MNSDQQVKQTVGPTSSVDSIVQPVSGSVNKESEPMSTGEYLRPSTPELELPEEVEKVGVQVTPERPQIKHIDRQTIEHAKESVPLANVPLVRLSAISDEDRARLKAGSPTDSGKFWITLYEFVLERINRKLAKKEG